MAVTKKTARLRRGGESPAARSERPFVVIGYSLGAVLARRKLAEQIESAGAKVLGDDMAASLAPMLASIAELKHAVPPSATEAMAKAIGALDDPLHAAFITRALNAVTSLACRLPADTIGEAIGQSSDFAVLLRVLSEPAVMAALRNDDPLAEAKLRGAQQRERIMAAEGGTLTVDEAAARLGVTRQAIHRRRQQGRLLGLPVGEHRYVYPAWQFTETGVLPGLGDVLAELSLRDAWTIAAFFLGGNTYLGGERPIDELRRGNVDGARRAAWAMGEQGAA